LLIILLHGILIKLTNLACFECEYACVENFSTTILFKELKNRFGLDPHILVEIFKSFANHSNVLRRDSKFILNLLGLLHILLKLINMFIRHPMLSSKKYVKSPPYPIRVKENPLYSNMLP
jgi:hypothetical protein